MKLTVAANYDPDLIPRLRPYPVEELYGKLPADVVGGGRPSYMSSPLTERQLSRYVALLTEHGIAFNYLLNSSCQGNREWGRAWQKQLMRFLARLGAMGIGRLTVSTPYLMELIKTRFPEFRVKVGIYAQVDTPRRARFWCDLGADAITVESFSINRDFERLKSIRRAVDCELQLIVNHHCLPNCPLQPYHQNAFAHASDGSRRLLLDYCFFQCSQYRLTDPSQLIKSQWIRPEDLPAYESLGYHTFKILERNCPSAELLQRVQAYSQRRFKGNLAEILLPYGFRRRRLPLPTHGSPARSTSTEQSQASRAWVLRHFFRPWQINPLKLRRLYRLAKNQGMLFSASEQPIVIDAAEIPKDFLDGFAAVNCAEQNCADCGYCERIAQRAVRIDPEFRERSLGELHEFAESVKRGGLWGLYPRQVAPEVMDDPDLAAESHIAALHGLARLNRFQRAASTFWPLIRTLAGRTHGVPLRVLDIGTGGGDIPLRLWQLARRARVPLEIMGIDMSPRAIELARTKAAQHGAPIRFEVFDVMAGECLSGFDVVLSSLLLHHFADRDAIAVLEKMGRAARQLVLVSDLERSRLNTFLIAAAARVLTGSSVVRRDAILSARAAFTISEVQGLARAAQLHDAMGTRRWPCSLLLQWRRPQG